MGLVSWLRNLFVSTDEGGRSKDSINPIKNLEPLNADNLNRAIYAVGGRVELLNKELEAISNSIMSRNIIIECMARGWSGYCYLGDGNSIKFAAGKVGIPPSTSMVVKLIDQSDEVAGTDIWRNSFIGIAVKDNNNKKGILFIKVKHDKEYDPALSKMSYGGDLAVKFVVGSALSASVEEDGSGKIKYLKIVYVPNTTTINDIVLVVNNLNSLYVEAEAVDDGSAKILDSLNGKIFSATDIFFDAPVFYKAYNTLSNGQYIVVTYKYVKSLEVEIPYDELKSFWDNNQLYNQLDTYQVRGLPNGHILAVRIPVSSSYIDGTISGADKGRAAQVMSPIPITADDLVILSSWDAGNESRYQFLTSGKNGIYIPIAKASNPGANTINLHARGAIWQIDDLSYVDFADGVRVGSGKIYHEFLKDEVCVSDTANNLIGMKSFGPVINNATWTDLDQWYPIVTNQSANVPYSDVYSAAEIVLVIYNNGVTTQIKEGKEFLILRDFMALNTNNGLRILFTDGATRNLFASAGSNSVYLYYTQGFTNIESPGVYHPNNPMPIPFDATHDNNTIFKNGDSSMVTGDLHSAVRKLGYALDRHLLNSSKYEHKDGTISGNMIANGAINESKIANGVINPAHIKSANNQNWNFKETISIEGTYEGVPSPSPKRVFQVGIDQGLYSNDDNIAVKIQNILFNYRSEVRLPHYIGGSILKRDTNLVAYYTYNLSPIMISIGGLGIDSNTCGAGKLVASDATNLVAVTNVFDGALGVYLFSEVTGTLPTDYTHYIAIGGVTLLKVGDNSNVQDKSYLAWANDGSGFVVAVSPNPARAIALGSKFQIGSDYYCIGLLLDFRRS